MGRKKVIVIFIDRFRNMIDHIVAISPLAEREATGSVVVQEVLEPLELVL